MHARIENNQIVEYPIYDLPSILNTPIVGDLTLQENLPSDIVYVQLEDRPFYDITSQRLEYGAPYLLNGKWYGPWITVNLTEEEKIGEYNLHAGIQRQNRNVLLLNSDWTQVADSPVNKQAWALYRQALRDVTAQPGFPFNIVWPKESDFGL